MTKIIHGLETGQMQGRDQPVPPRATLLPQKGLGNPAPSTIAGLPFTRPSSLCSSVPLVQGSLWVETEDSHPTRGLAECCSGIQVFVEGVCHS